MLPYFGDTIAGQTSHMPQSRIRGSVLAICLQVEGPVMRGTQRISRLPRGQTFQLRKTLRNFFQNFDFKCFGSLPWRLVGDSPQQRKTRVWQKVGQLKKIKIKKPFQFSLELFMTIHFLSQLKLTQTLRVILYKLHFCTFSPPNLQEKGMGSHFLTSYLMF